MTPEFSRPERADQIGERERVFTIAADQAERAALAKRFDLVSIDRLEARFALRRDAVGILAKGRVTGAVVQACSVTDDPIPVRVDEPIDLRFVEESIVEDEVELSEDSLDTMPVENGVVDLGEAAAETLALSLDPFPRGPNAAAALKAAGVISEEEAKPSGALAGLRAKLEGRG